MADDSASDRVYRAAVGPELIQAALRLVAAAPSAERFPQEQPALEQLVEHAGAENEDTGVRVELERGEALPRYLGPGHLWVAPVADGALRLRAEYGPLRALTGYVWPDGRLSELISEEGFWVPDDELTTQARADIPAVERDQRDRVEADAEYERTRFRGETLLRVLSPPWQDPAQLVITSVEVYAAGLVVSYLLPRPGGDEPPAPDDDSLLAAALPKIEVLDDAGTTYELFDGHVDDVTGPVLRANQTFMPGVSAGARFLVVKSSAGSVEIPLEETP